MKKMKLFNTIALFSFVFLLTLFSCEIGLGSSVDTAAPKIEILTPEVNSVHKEVLKITGTATDEISIRSVNVNLVLNGVSKYSYNANVTPNGEWVVEIPTVNNEGNNVVQDAKYEIQAVATDSDGKTSVATRSLQVDNTPPTILVTSPSLFDDNKSSFFRQLRVSGSAYDASEISNVKVYFYSKDKFTEDSPFSLENLENDGRFVSYNAEGTNSWNLTQDLPEKDAFFENNLEYNFFVIAEDEAGNKNTYFYRMGDFYNKEIIKDTTNDGDDYIPFPSMMQIGKFDQGLTVENPTSGLSAEGLESIKIHSDNSEENNSNFLYRSESAPSVSWGNIEFADGVPRTIPRETDITGQIKTSDTTDILPASVEVWLASGPNAPDEDDWWKLDDEYVTLDPSGTSAGFNIVLKKDGEALKSGDYFVRINYKTIASINSSEPLSGIQPFGISAGLPVLTETELLNNGTSPVNVQFYSNSKDGVVLGGKAQKGDGTSVEKLFITLNDEEIESPKIAENGEWSLEIKDEGSYKYEIRIEDGGNTSSLSRTVIIDTTKPDIENMSFEQSADMKIVTIRAFVTDENSIENISYAFVKDDKEPEDSDWVNLEKKEIRNSLKIDITAPNAEEFQQGPWTLWIKATDKAENVEKMSCYGILDLKAPEFETFETTTIPENGYINKDFYYINSELENDTVIATDNYNISKIEIVAKKDGSVVKSVSVTKEVNKAKLTKSDLADFPVIKGIAENQGKWIVTITLYDSNNNKIEKTVDFSIDVTSPTITIEKVPQATDNNSSPFEFRGTANDNASGVNTIYVSLDNTTWESLEGLKSWGKELKISQKGPGTVYAYAVDGAGNVSSTTKKDFVFDSANPELKVTTQDGKTAWNIGTNYTLEGTASDDWGLPKNPIKITQSEKTDDGIENTIELTGITFPDGKWKIQGLPRDKNNDEIPEAEMPTKTYEYEITLTDNANKETKTKITVSIDKTAPNKLEILTPQGKTGNLAINSTEYKFSGITEDTGGTANTGIREIQYIIKENDSKPTENDTLNVVQTKGNWEFIESGLTEGNFWLFVKSVDNAGNKTDFVKENFHVDFSNPTLNVGSLDKNQKDFYTLSGTASDTKGLKSEKAITIVQKDSNNNELKTEISPAIDGKWKSISLPLKADNVSATDKNSCNGVYTYTITVEDWCGKINSKTITVNFDTVAPKVEITNLSDNTYLSKNTETVRGVVSDASKIHNVYYAVGKTQPEIPGDVLGEWSKELWTSTTTQNSLTIELKNLENGENSLYIVVVDELGNFSQTTIRNIIVDTKSPTVEITSNDKYADKALNTGSYDLNVAANDNLALEKIQISVSHNGTTVETIKAENNEKTVNWEKTIEAKSENEGTWIFTINAYDKAGNVSETKTKKVLVDTKKPVFTKQNIENEKVGDFYKGKSLNLLGQVNDENGIESVEYSLNENDWYPCAFSKKYDNGTYYEFSANIQVDKNLKDTIYIRATDTVGNLGSCSLTGIKVDITPPTIEIISNTSNIFINSSTDLKLNLITKDDESGSGVASVKAKIGSSVFDDPDATPESDDFTSLTISSEKFENYKRDAGTVYLQVEDKCGNTNQTSFMFKKDTTPPSVSITSHEKEAKVNGEITLSGTTIETQGLASVEVLVKGDQEEVFSGEYGFNWSCKIDTTKYPDNSDLSIKVVATDNAGNKGETPLTLKIDQKSDRPVITINNTPAEGNFINTNSIFGSITDDDGQISVIKVSRTKITSLDGWSSIPETIFGNGVFVYTLAEDDGPKELWFYIKDADNKKFITSQENDATDAPVLVYNGETNTQSLSFNLNMKPPVIQSAKVIYTDSTETAFETGLKVGGTNKTFDILVDVTDGNGIKAVSLKVGDSEISGEYSGTDTDSKNGSWKISVNDEIADSLAEGDVEFEITVTDKADSSSTLTKTLLVDNTPPVVVIESHNTEEKKLVTGSVRISGSATDDKEVNGKKINSSGIKSLKWLIPTKADENLSDEIIIAKDNWKNVTGTSSWNYTFEKDDDSGINGELSAYVEDNNVNYGTNIDNTNIWKLPIYLLVEDNVGNQALTRNFYLNVDPAGDKPRAYITFPTTGLTLGGKISAYGDAKDNEGVKEVHIQIDVDGDKEFNSNDREILSSNYTIENPQSEKDWYIKVDAQTIWQTTLNTNGELNPTEVGGKRIVHLRVRAKDIQETVGMWSESVELTIDSSAPRIGTNDGYRLVQYEKDDYNSNEIASIPYTPDMWITGKWWFVTSVQDENGIAEVSIELDSKSDPILSADDMKQVDVGEGGFSEEGDTGKRIYIPLDTEKPGIEQSSNLIAFKIHATDGSSPAKNSDFSVSIKYDNTAPNINFDLKHSDSVIGDGKEDKTVVITQSNNAYEIASSVIEAGSGFSRLAIYFKRYTVDENGKQNNIRIYNPVLTKDTTGNRTDLGSGVEIIDNLPRLTVTGATRGENTIKHVSLIGNPNIRVGGLVRIAGAERLITDVDTDNGIVTFTPSVSKEFTNADFAYALVVDNFKVENATYNEYGIPTKIDNDDGDGVVESVEKNGATYDWTLSINSKNIPDGPIDICYVAFDEAGNPSDLKTVSTSVQNNRPAIAKVWLGTDLDGDGTVDEDEEVVYREDITTKKAEYEVTLDTKNEDGTRFTAKDKTTIRPEIVGGNGNLYYFNNLSSNSSGNYHYYEKKDDKDEGVLLQRANYNEENKITNLEEASILLSLDSESKTLAGVPDGEKQTFSFTIWDSTEECTVGTDTQWASLTVTMDVDVVDEDEPTVVINPLYWESEEDNSLYDNSRDNGHIELSKDLPDIFDKTRTTGLMDRDDKVSGQISFRGEASDNQRITTLYVALKGFTFVESDTIIEDDGKIIKDDGTTYYKLATFDSGSWSGTDDKWNSLGYKFTAKTDYINQQGHKVLWQFDIDTAKIPNVVGLDKQIKILVKDTRNESLEKSYQVDVVPYITGVKRTGTTKSNTTMNRSTYGEYPIAVGDTIEVTGFNLGTGFKVGNTTVTVTESTATKVYTLSGITNSGELTVTVNTVTNLNASNNNSKSYNQDVDNAKWFDNRYLRVWDVDHYFTGSMDRNEPTMVADTTGNLFSSWTIMGSAQVQMQKNLSGTTKAVWISYDQPDLQSHIAVDTKSSNELSLIFSSPHVGSSGKGISNGYADLNVMGGMIGTGVPNDFNKITTTATTVSIANNPYTTMDKTTSPGYQLASYAMRRDVSQYTYGKSARFNNDLHFAYYDKKNKALRYTYQSMSTDRTSWQRTISGWILIDGKSDGQDRVHGGNNDTWSNDGYTVSSAKDKDGNVTAVYIESNRVTFDNNVTAKEGDTLGIAYESKNGEHKFELFTINSNVNNSRTVTFDGAFDTDNYSGIPKGAIYKGASNVVTKGADKVSSAGSYLSLDVTNSGKPVIVYFDSDNETLRIAYSTSATPSMINVANGRDTFTRQTISGVSGGTYVQAKIDPKNNLHIMYRDSDGQLCYIKSKSNEAGEGPDGGAYSFEKPMVIETSGTYGTLSLMKDGTNYVPCVAFLNSEGTANGVKYSLLRNVDTGLLNVDTGDTTEALWDTMVVPAVVSGGNHYVTGGELVYVEGKSGSWSEIQDKDTVNEVNTADCDAIVGFNTGRMDVVFLKSEYKSE